VKSGAGTLTLSGANTYSGTTSVSAGTLRATTSAGALGTGTLNVSGTGAVELANDTGLNFARNTTVSATTANFTSGVLTNGNTGVTHTLGTLSIGAQNLVLSKGANVGSGTAGLTFGATTLSATGATFTANTGTQLTLGAVSGNTNSFTVNGSGNTTISGIIATTTGTLAKSGTGTLTLSGANTYTGATTVSGGTLSVGSSSALLNSALTIGSNVAGGTAVLALGSNNATVPSLTIGGATGGDTASVSNITGTGTLTLGGNVTFSSTGDPLGSTISANLNLGSASRTIQVNDSTTAPSDLTISGVLSGNASVGFTKTGTGTLQLSGANTYTGPTTISAGKLIVNGLLAAASAVSVNSTGTLGGSGTIGGTVTINTGGNISPGNTAVVPLSPGTLTTGAETWSGGGGYVWELNDASDAGGAKGVTYDWLNSTGALTLNNTSGSPFTIYMTSLTAGNTPGLVPNFVEGTSYSYTFATASGGITGFSTNKFVVDTVGFSNPIKDVAIFRAGNDLILSFTAIPEPSTYAIGIAGLLGVVILFRRRRA
jgi:autotransporter-associated beta strand protein